ncbi:TatD family hydrolase [Prevotella sp.]|uniref:TatD family hydrolase n=1 Tax=Prevotella sp. TaxID=59823 RepID=UPI0030779A8B
MNFIDTHTHLDGEEFDADRNLVIERAQEAGVSKVFVPAIDMKSVKTVLDTCQRYPGYAYPMIGLHPEEVRADWSSVLDEMHQMLKPGHPFIAIGEVGLDYYWSREFEHEQLQAFERQVEWSIETRLPLMIHCRKGQNEMVKLLNQYRDQLPGGVFHCFTGNEKEAEELLQFNNFVLGIGGVLTFKKSHLPEVLPAVVPLDRIVIETDSPYMAPVPMRGKRNESAYVKYVLERLALTYGVDDSEVAAATNANAERIFPLAFK